MKVNQNSRRAYYFAFVAIFPWWCFFSIVQITSDLACTNHFFGCTDGTSTPAPQDQTRWSPLRFTLDQAFPVVPPGSMIRSVSIVYDEGMATPSAQDPNGLGPANIDNINIDGDRITSGPSHGNGDDVDIDHGNDQGNGHGNGHGDHG